MLQRNPDSLVRMGDTRSTAMSPADLISALTSLARRRAGLIVLIFGLSVVCGAIYLRVTPARYLAQASLIIDTRKSQLFSQQVVGESAIDSATVDSQIEVL